MVGLRAPSLSSVVFWASWDAQVYKDILMGLVAMTRHLRGAV